MTKRVKYEPSYAQIIRNLKCAEDDMDQLTDRICELRDEIEKLRRERVTTQEQYNFIYKSHQVLVDLIMEHCAQAVPE